MSVPSTPWSETSPAGSDQINAGDNRIREMKTQIREVIDTDHNMPSSGSSATTGFHNRMTLIEEADNGTGAEGLPILGAQTVDGKAELVFTDEDDNDVQITKEGKIHAPSLNGVYPATLANLASIMNFIYPVGSVVTLGVSTNPATLFGVGTWTAIAGRVIVGIDSTQTEFDTLNETGGEKTHLLTGAESGTSAHTHTIASSSSDNDQSAQNSKLSSLQNNQTVTTDVSTEANASSAHNNLQPYIVKYVWERTV